MGGEAAPEGVLRTVLEKKQAALRDIQVRMYVGTREAQEHVASAIVALVTAGAVENHKALFFLEVVESLLMAEVNALEVAMRSDAE